MPLADVARFVSELMQATESEYVVIGGVAASAVGEPRATKDVDVVVLVAPEKAENLLEAIEHKGLKISRRPEVLRKLKEGKPAKILWDKKFSFDLRLASYGIDAKALSRSILIAILKLGVTLRIVSPEDLIVYKLARFEDIDKRDIRGVVRTTEMLDWPYIVEETNTLAGEIGKPELLVRLAEILTWR